LRSSFIFTGIACILQGLIGHRFPLMEGHSGVIWGLVLNLFLSASAMGVSLETIGGGVATGMLLAGAVIIVLGAFNLLSIMRVIFTPMVMTVFLFLLTFQLIFIFIEGMLKFTDDGMLDIPVSLFSIGVVLFVCLLKIKGNRTIGNFSILIGIVVGWALYSFVFPSSASAILPSAVWHIPIFPFGAPNWHTGIVLVTFIASLVNASNTITAVEAAAHLFREKVSEKQVRISYLLTASYSVIGSILGLVAYAPFASSIGFLESTQIWSRKPFLIGGALLSILGLIPYAGGMLATMPITVANAVLFAAYMQLFGTSLKSVQGVEFNSVTIHRLAVPVLAGVGIMAIGADRFANLPVLIQPLVTNGFIVGVLLSIAMEKLIRWNRTV